MSSRAQSLEPTCPIGDRQSMGTNEATRDPQSSSLSSRGNASVPPLSQGTSSDARSSFPARHTLPVFALRARIVDKIRENRVTLVIGDTGCGKSSQVPQFLLEEDIQPILCTQPRRFAVVAIARMVAEARNCEVGGEVGYHIGHSNVSSSSSKIIFKTAGVLLEQMRDRGLAALKYKVIILDEVHERSVESDLVLACVKQFMMKNKGLRVVLMSATADISRYKDYFKDLGRSERVEVLAIPYVPQQVIFQRKVLYLEQISELVDLDKETTDKCITNCKDLGDAGLKNEVHTLIHKLILHIHNNESDIEKSILVFLPTYYLLERQWILLKEHLSVFKVHILHRSIDTESALSAMQIWKSHRKVILATNIAESSVTIPGVAFVIDSCRSLQVFWDQNRNIDTPKLVWVSKSQAEQRKGRTGRTCDGHIYRLVPGQFYSGFDDHEFPAILRLSLRQHVLMVCCADSKAINDPKVLLQKLMDPPYPVVVEIAINQLLNIKALNKHPTHKGSYEPTFYGRLLDSLPLTFDPSVLLLKFGDIGLLHEGIIISILMDIQPFPIIQPFGKLYLHEQYVANFFEDDKTIGKKENILMGNLSSYYFWQCIFKDKLRMDRLKQLLNGAEPKSSLSLIHELEKEWCYLHNLVPTTLNNISDIYEDALCAIHRFRPMFLQMADSLPSYYDPYDFKHTCLIQSESHSIDSVNENPESTDRSKCTSLPFVTSNDFQVSYISEEFVKLIKEIRGHNTDEKYEDRKRIGTSGCAAAKTKICKYFIRGLCNKNDQCIFSHSFQAKKPPCKFFFTLQGCRYGNSCIFSHDNQLQNSSFMNAFLCSPEDSNERQTYDIFLHLLPAASEGCILILNDKHLQITSILAKYIDPHKLIVSIPDQPSSEVSSSLIGLTKVSDTSLPWSLNTETKGEDCTPWAQVRSILWFSDFDVDEAEKHHNLLKKFFQCLAIKFLAGILPPHSVIITMNNLRFSQIEVEKLARECFFFLTQSFLFDASTFGKISHDVCAVKPMQASSTISYIFEIHLPPAHTMEVKDHYSSSNNNHIDLMYNTEWQF